MGRPRVWNICTAPLLRTGTSKASVPLRLATDPFLTFNSPTSLYQTTALLVPASRTSVSSPRSSTLARSCRAVHKQRAGRRGSCLRNSWFPKNLARKTRYPHCSRTFTRLDWSSSRYASSVTDVCCFVYNSLQVLTGETPFLDIRQSAFPYRVLRGTRPIKPENALAIGFSGSLWGFTQRCWDGTIESRPKVGEVVKHLKEAAAGWDGPPRPLVDDVASGPEEMSSSEKHSKIQILVLP